MIIGRNRDSNRYEYLLTILLAALVSLLVNIGWCLQRLEHEPRPIINKVCNSPISTINKQRPQTPPVFMRDRMP